MKLYVIPQIKELNKWIELSSKYDLGFEYNDFFNPSILDNEDELKERINIYKKLNRNGDTLHGVFFDINFASNDKKIKEISISRAISSLKIAEELNCKGVVFHTNYETWIKDEKYRNTWLKDTVKVYKELLNKFPNIDIYVENMFDEDPKLLSELAKELKEEKHFGVCLDVAHAYISRTPLNEWFDCLRPYIKHIHLNDNDKYYDSHLQLGKGTIDLEYIFNEIYNISNVSVLLEMNKYEDALESIKIVKKVL